MSDKKSNIKTYLILAFFLIVLPNALVFYLDYDSKNTFRRYLLENEEICAQRAERDKFPVEVCNQIKTNARDTFNESRNFLTPTVLLFSTLIYNLAIVNVGLRKQIDELKEKIDA